MGEIPSNNGEEQQRLASTYTRSKLYFHSYNSHHPHCLLHRTQPLHHPFPLPPQKPRRSFFLLPHPHLQYHLRRSRLAHHCLPEPRHFRPLPRGRRINLRGVPRCQPARDLQENEQASLPVMLNLHRLAGGAPPALGLLRGKEEFPGIQGVSVILVPMGPVDDNHNPADVQPMIKSYYLMLMNNQISSS